MNTILVWVALLQTLNGQLLQIDNIANQSDCERIVARFVASNRSMYVRDETHVAGTCTQYHKFVPAPMKVDAPVINVQPASPKVIIKKG